MRWAYNYYLGERLRVYNESKDSDRRSFLSTSDAIKDINILKKKTHTWLNDVSSYTIQRGVMDAYAAYNNYFQNLQAKPKFKSKKYSKLSFYTRYNRLRAMDGGFRAERIGFVKTTEPLPKIPKGVYYKNPHISYDGKYWYLSVGYEVEPIRCELTGESVGIDLGIKDLAVCSDGTTYKNINKSHEVKRLEKVLKREQRKLSKKMESHITEYRTIGNKRFPVFDKELNICKNYQKQKNKIKLLYRRLTNIRNNHIHQATAEIVKTKPSRVVMETLNVSGMVKNKHLAKAVLEQKFYEFTRQMKYKTEKYGIEFIQVPMFYPSSKTCSQCGAIKKDLRLSDRIYRCDCCGLEIDRDYNASINLAKYEPV